MTADFVLRLRERLAELRAEERRASDEPWTNQGRDDEGIWVLGGGVGMKEHAVAVMPAAQPLVLNRNADADAALIVSARNCWPGLLDAIEEILRLYNEHNVFGNPDEQRVLGRVLVPLARAIGVTA